MDMLIRATWSAGVEDGGVDEKGASAEERRLEATDAEEAMGEGADLSRVLIKGKDDGAVEGC